MHVCVRWDLSTDADFISDAIEKKLLVEAALGYMYISESVICVCVALEKHVELHQCLKRDEDLLVNC